MAGLSAFILYMNMAHLNSRGLPSSVIWSLWGVIFAIALITLTVMPFWWRWQQNKRQQPLQPELPKTVSAPMPKHHASINALRQTLRHHYGLLWPLNARFLLLTGRTAEVEQLAPGLTTQYWQEDRGTVLLWGGDPDEDADAAWLGALRKLRRRPLDGLVWVTATLDRPLSLGVPENAPTLCADAMDRLAHALSVRCEALGARLPLFVWSLHAGAGGQPGRITQPVGCLLPPGCRPQAMARLLAELIPALAAQGTQQACDNSRHLFLLSLADQLTRRPDGMTEPLAILLNPYRPLALAGVMFSPASAGAARSVQHHWGRDNRWDLLLRALPSLPPGLKARKTGFAWGRALRVAAVALMVLWAAGMAMSFLVNRHMVENAREQARQAASAQLPLPMRLESLLVLQQTLDRLQYRSQHGVPWHARFGLSQNEPLLAALWPRYGRGALPLLRDAAAERLAQRLNALIQLPPDSPLRALLLNPAYNQLKLYLMLTRSGRMEAGWFASALLKDWPRRDGVPDGAWQGQGPALLAFYAANLARHPEWRLRADDNLVSQARTLLVRQMGMRNSDASLYQKMLARIANQYADMRLRDMTGDTDAARLFTTDEVVPGMFTRQAWEEAVQPAIDKTVADRREEMDWVLSDHAQPAAQQTSPEALRARLTERYFADFAGSWLGFLNSLRWRRAVTLSDAVDQLTLMADVRQSPLVALMNTLSFQGRAGQTGRALADSLVKSAKELFNRDAQPAIDQQAEARGPMDATFGPLLALMDGQESTTLSLRTFLTRVTQVRLRLQQATGGADPQAMTQALAQTVFQGKSVDLTATRDYGSLVAASLGQEWSGFGQTVFVQPMEQSWQKVLLPAAASLNAQWRAAIVEDWNSTFGGRYPFKNVGSEASLPLLAQYLNADSGRITRFLQTRLGGVLHKEGSRWVPDSINAQGLAFDPAFLNAVNLLSHLADVVFTTGEAGLHFELRPGTAAGVMETKLTVDGRKLTYVNQIPAWQRFAWPADTEAPGASLSWVSTQAGTRQFADLPGAWGWIRLLDKAGVTPYPGVGSSFSLAWKAPDGRSLNYTLRTEAGEGPLALLKLRNFTLPARIFRVNNAAEAATDHGEFDD
ncbi:type VI secretion protein VasK [Enterobacteriales bacterium SAP-6]|uniref:Type VI secretion protein VasK n=2 Tax=Acerihabitans arboris TaxID=2691583 RepID=A0A845SNM1_9GAMM|nr:type VI secretion protein VasK [Acerihabitans arboris]